MQRTPAGLPFGIPGIGDEIDGAIQHAPQPTRQLIVESWVIDVARDDTCAVDKTQPTVTVPNLGILRWSVEYTW